MKLSTQLEQTALQIEPTGRSYYDKDARLSYLVQSLSKIVTLTSPYTMDHLNHVRDLSLMLARRIKFPVEQLKSLEYAAVLHDIGKIAIGEYVVNKPTRLTQTEDSMMRQHPLWGHTIVQSLLFDPLVCDVILYHHENYDGSGYPVGLSGDKIPLAARIVRTTDSYDAMTSGRPYHSPCSSRQAVELLKKDSRYFDPALLNEFLTTLAAKPLPRKLVATRNASVYQVTEK